MGRRRRPARPRRRAGGRSVSSSGSRSGRRCCPRCCSSPAARPTGSRFARARTRSAWLPSRCGGSIAAAGSAARIRPTGWIIADVAVARAHDAAPATQPAARRRGADSLCISPSCVPCSGRRRLSSHRQQLVRALVVLLVCNGINSAVGVHAGVRPRPLDAAAALVGVPGRRAATCARRLHLHRAERPPHDPAAGPVRFARRGGRRGHGRRRCSAWCFAWSRSGWWKRGVSLGFALAGMSALYLSHVRAAFVMTLGMMAAYLAMLAVQNQKKRAVGFGVLAIRPGRRRLVRRDDPRRGLGGLGAVHDAARRRPARSVLPEPRHSGGVGDDGSGRRISARAPASDAGAC